MSLKELFKETMKDTTLIATLGVLLTFVTNLITYMVVKPKDKAEADKTNAEKQNLAFDLQVKEGKFIADKYDKLLERVEEYEKDWAEIRKEMDAIKRQRGELELMVQSLSQKLLKSEQERGRLLSELNIYKATAPSTV